MKRVLFVCTGNICRSPTAEGVARAMAERLGLAEGLHFDSAGLAGYHVGDPPDPRAIERARLRGYELSSLKARRVTRQDFERFDLILAMDRDHFHDLREMCPPERWARVQMFLGGSDKYPDVDVPDPYYGTARDFDVVLDLCEDRMPRLLTELGASR